MNPYRDAVELVKEKVGIETPDSKAWNYFKEVVGKESIHVVDMLKDGKYIEVTGSEGGKYYLYPDGAIARILNTGPTIGRVYYNASMPKADFLSAIYIWITQAEEKLIKVWGCGNLSIGYDKNVSPYNAGGAGNVVAGDYIPIGTRWVIPENLRLDGSVGMVCGTMAIAYMGT